MTDGSSAAGADGPRWEWNWQKTGLVYGPRADDWMESHAQLPVAMPLDGDRYRVYVAGRTADNMSQVGSVDIDVTAPTEPLAVASDPLVDLGALGTFDDSGVFPSSVVRTDEAIRLYYVGWMRGDRVPYYACVGLAVSRDGGRTFEKHSRGPLLPRTDVDPYMTLSSCVRRENDRWRMWYTAATGWESREDGPRPNYHIRYAESADGIDWTREGTVCIDYAADDEWAIAAPSVHRIGDRYAMWYSYVRGHDGYRMGYAESADGIEWTRHDGAVGLDVSETGWDDEMTAYPNVFTHDGTWYMLYNGNDYGAAGFGLAHAEDGPRP
jgi:predicted GH43/DUF377 family glycosyl hydrolase